MPGDDDNPAKRQLDPRGTADRILEEKLRQIGADILDEPVPEALRRVLRRTGGSDNGATSNVQDHRAGRDQPPRLRGDKRSS